MRKTAIITLLFVLLVSLGAPAQAQNMVRGSKGDDVAALQTRLIELGYLDDEIDGVFGKLAVAAVSQFQKQYGLPSTGEADEALQALILADTAPQYCPAYDQSILFADTEHCGSSEDGAVWMWAGSQLMVNYTEMNEPSANSGILSVAIGGRNGQAVPMLVLQVFGNDSFAANRLSISSSAGELQLRFRSDMCMPMNGASGTTSELFILPMGNDGVAKLASLENAPDITAILDGEVGIQINLTSSDGLSFHDDLVSFMKIWRSCGGFLLDLSQYDTRFPVEFLPAA